jgi:hypothetical protein
MTKRLLGGLLLVSVIGNLFLLYTTVDQAVTIDHHGSELSRRQNQLNAAAKLFRPIVKDAPGAMLLTTAQKEGLEILPKTKNELYIEQIQFELADGKVSDFSFE